LVNSAQHRSFNSIQHIFSRFKDKNYIPRFRKYISENGTTAQKFQEIKNHVFNDFKRARNNFLIIHDCDLQRWAKNKARELDFEFKASNSWLSRFKKRNGIVSRKVNKILSTNYVQDQETIKQSANEFLNNSKQVMRSLDESNTFNSDQSGFNYILTSGRTLSEEDEKVTLSSVSLL
jgi:hypothetical protein